MKQTCVLTVLAVFVAASVASAAPVRLARTPDYHAGKIAFSYLGDIWVVNEDGSNRRASRTTPGATSTPASHPTAGGSRFSSNRFGNNDVFVVAAAGGKARRLTWHTGNDEVVGWSPDSATILFRASHGDGVFPGTATLYRSPRRAGPRRRSRSTGAGGATCRPTATASCSTAIPRRGRASTTAAATPPTSGWRISRRRPTSPSSPERTTTATGRCGGRTTKIYFVGDPLPNEKAVKPGAPEVRQSRSKHLQDRGERRRASRCR